jgi:phage tail sheath protein FI
LLSRTDEAAPGCLPGMVESEPVLRASARLAREIDQADREKLVKHGINVLLGVRSAERHRAQLRTMAGGANAAADWGYLGARRFALYVLDALVRGTRWAVSTPTDLETWRSVERQVSEFLQGLHADGAFSGIPFEQACSVICDERINEDSVNSGELHLLVRFVAIHPGEHHCFMIVHGPYGSTVRAVAMNRLEGAMGDAEVEVEVETGRTHVPILTVTA